MKKAIVVTLFLISLPAFIFGFIYGIFWPFFEEGKEQAEKFKKWVIK